MTAAAVSGFRAPSAHEVSLSTDTAPTKTEPSLWTAFYTRSVTKRPDMNRACRAGYQIRLSPGQPAGLNGADMNQGFISVIGIADSGFDSIIRC